VTDKLRAVLEAHRKVGRREEWVEGGTDRALCACGAETVHDADSFEARVADAIREAFQPESLVIARWNDAGWWSVVAGEQYDPDRVAEARMDAASDQQRDGVARKVFAIHELPEGRAGE
jgi:hypothetical protein